MGIHSYIDQINNYIKELSTNKDNIFVLEAGCGSESIFYFGARAYVIGIDISLTQLEKNNTVHQKILGDIQSIKFRPSSFDIIVCWYVLEHLPRPEMGLYNFSQILKANGILIIAVPNVMSLKGLIAKFTPYIFHYWSYRHIYKSKDVPFPTYCKWIISPKSLMNYAKDNNLNVQLLQLDDWWIKFLKNKSFIIYTIYLGLGLISKVLTFGNISITKTDCYFIFKKYTMQEMIKKTSN